MRTENKKTVSESSTPAAGAPPATEGESSQIRVIIVEDNDSLRPVLASMVKKSPALKLLGDFSNAEAALAGLRKLSPDVALIDIMLPRMDGISCIEVLRRELPECRVLVLTSYDDTNLIVKALSSGASGYLIKTASLQDFVQSIQDVWSGGAPMSASVARKVVEVFRESKNAGCENLTTKEQEMLRLLSQGYLVKEIADMADVSYATVRFHLRNIYGKLHVNSRSQAIVKYLGSPSVEKSASDILNNIREAEKQ